MNVEALKALAAKVEAGQTLKPYETSAVWPTIYDRNKSQNVLTWLEACKASHGSLDAAKALHDAVLPGWGWRIDHKYGDGIPGKYEYKRSWVSEPHSWRRGYTADVSDENEARAWLLAVLKALIAQGMSDANE